MIDIPSAEEKELVLHKDETIESWGTNIAG